MPRSKGRTGRPWRRMRERVRRSQNTCWICGEPIDLSLQWPHPRSFSVDHKEPLIMRPELATVYSNMAAAHLGCNSSRGTGQVAKQPQSRLW